MATYNEYLKGKAKWSYTHRLNKFGDWSIDLYLDNESKEKALDLIAKGLKNTLKKDEDGYYIRLKRQPKKVIKDYQTGGQKELTFTQPLVFDLENNVTNDTIIGNGSDVTVKIQVYNFGGKGGIAKGIAARLEAVRIDNLVPYTRENLSEEDERQSRGITEQPEHEF